MAKSAAAIFYYKTGGINDKNGKICSGKWPHSHLFIFGGTFRVDFLPLRSGILKQLCCSTDVACCTRASQKPLHVYPLFNISQLIQEQKFLLIFIGCTPKGAYSTRGRSRHLLETPLLRTPSENPSQNPFLL